MICKKTEILKKGDVKAIFSIFKRKAKNSEKGSDKPKTVVFVDYEHWYISLEKMHRMRPDIRSWRDSIAEKYEIQEIVFFGDFSNSSLRKEIPKIREITNYIIETQNTTTGFKKDFTDFIMLDHIYQKAMKSRDIDTFILFSGDGHFNSVVNFLITQMGKKVGVYGIKEAMSNQLRNSASWYQLLPEDVDPNLQYYTMILKNLKYLEDRSTQGKRARPTFMGTVDAVSRINRVSKSIIRDALSILIDKEYITQDYDNIYLKNKIKILKVDWKKCKKDKLFKD